MLEALKAENPVTCQAEELHCEQEAAGISSYDAVPSSSKHTEEEHHCQQKE